MNFFEWFGLPIRLTLDEEDLRRRYVTLSRRWHPDYYADRPAAEQEEALRMATFNTQAYETLRHSDRRLRYVLELAGLLEEEGRQQVPKDFLFEIMELNEAIQEAGNDAERRSQVQQQLDDLLQKLEHSVQSDIASFQGDLHDRPLLERIRDYYLKRRYLLRLQQRLDSFEPDFS
ncbi:MAG: Fe-S protein assembly co-chaperone HscB [Chitinophagales bacterium]|nr:Fe-S protein assembly co-chaperone HscB [Chitinophagales bacterium]MDW8428323.1 Fe-S protein assembly co-chaperone HscB [Chitinophagales bacterium]